MSRRFEVSRSFPLAGLIPPGPPRVTCVLRVTATGECGKRTLLTSGSHPNKRSGSAVSRSQLGRYIPASRYAAGVQRAISKVLTHGRLDESTSAIFSRRAWARTCGRRVYAGGLAWPEPISARAAAPSCAGGIKPALPTSSPAGLNVHGFSDYQNSANDGVLAQLPELVRRANVGWVRVDARIRLGPHHGNASFTPHDRHRNPHRVHSRYRS